MINKNQIDYSNVKNGKDLAKLVMLNAQPNLFLTGVTTKLLDKVKENPQWKAEFLEQFGYLVATDTYQNGRLHTLNPDNKIFSMALEETLTAYYPIFGHVIKSIAKDPAEYEQYVKALNKGIELEMSLMSQTMSEKQTQVAKDIFAMVIVSYNCVTAAIDYPLNTEHSDIVLNTLNSPHKTQYLTKARLNKKLDILLDSNTALKDSLIDLKSHTAKLTVNENYIKEVLSEKLSLSIVNELLTQTQKETETKSKLLASLGKKLTNQLNRLNDVANMDMSLYTKTIRLCAQKIEASEVSHCVKTQDMQLLAQLLLDWDKQESENIKHKEKDNIIINQLTDYFPPAHKVKNQIDSLRVTKPVSEIKNQI